MTTCGFGPCDAFKAFGKDGCLLCWWHEQPQPETLIERIARRKREAENDARKTVLGAKKTRRPGEIEEEYYGQAALRVVERKDPTKRPRSRKGPNYVPASAWVSPT